MPVENADAVREAMFAAGAGHIGDYSHCSWGVTGTGQFLPHDGASPTIGSVGSVEQVAEDRVEMIAPARLRGHVLAALRTAHPYEEPAFDILELASVPPDVGLGRIGVLPTPQTLAAFVSRVHDALPGTSWGIRASGEDDAEVSRVAVCGGRRRLASGRRRGRGRGCLRDGRPATPPRRRASAALRRRADRRRALGKRVSVVQSGGRAAPRPLRGLIAGAGVRRPHRSVEHREKWSMKAEVMQQRSLLELADLDAELSRIEHRASHLAEQQRLEQAQAEHRDANDRLAALRLALDDLDAHIAKFESEIEGVRDREDRDRKMLDGGAINAKQLGDLQHELETLERRQASLEDSLLEVMERREELQAQQADELGKIDTLQSALAEAQRARDDALSGIDQTASPIVPRGATN